MEQQRAAQFSLHVAAADDLADVSPRRAIDQLRRQAGLAVVEDADDHAGAALLLRAAAFYGKFHRRSHARYIALVWPLGRASGIIGKSARKSQNFSAVMVFRRSLVRGLTATAVALFLVLL